jgi:hypothetical protein
MDQSTSGLSVTFRRRTDAAGTPTTTLHVVMGHSTQGKDSLSQGESISGSNIFPMMTLSRPTSTRIDHSSDPSFAAEKLHH